MCENISLSQIDPNKSETHREWFMEFVNDRMAKRGIHISDKDKYDWAMVVHWDWTRCPTKNGSASTLNPFKSTNAGLADCLVDGGALSASFSDLLARYSDTDEVYEKQNDHFISIVLQRS